MCIRDRATAAGAIASMVSGGVVTILWEVFGPVDEIRSVIVAAPAAVILLVVVSLLTKQQTSRAVA